MWSIAPLGNEMRYRVISCVVDDFTSHWAAPKSVRSCDPPVTPRPKIAFTRVAEAEFGVQNLVGGPGFEPGASRSRTLRRSCPRVSRRFFQCPSVLNFEGRPVPLLP